MVSAVRKTGAPRAENRPLDWAWSADGEESSFVGGNGGKGRSQPERAEELVGMRGCDSGHRAPFGLV